MKYPVKILVVEDNPTDRELLRYLLEAKFSNQVKFYEAPTLAAAFSLADHAQPDCVILDLNLPDSSGSETFTRLHERLPRTTPVIVMTHNKDRRVALDMIQTGAADYVIKNYTDDEELFRRVLFAIEKYARMVPVTTDDAAAFNRLEKVKANVAKAKRSNSVPNMYAANMEAAEAVAEASQRMITELSKVTTQLSEISKVVASQGAVQEHLRVTVETIDRELLRGHSGRPSMRSQVDVISHRMDTVETKVQSAHNAIEAIEDARQKEALEVRTTYVTSRTKILLGVLALLGAIAGAVATYEAGRAKNSVKTEESSK